jgi:5-(carboxyamino)imidazole ribonucleotide mutase
MAGKTNDRLRAVAGCHCAAARDSYNARFPQQPGLRPGRRTTEDQPGMAQRQPRKGAKKAPLVGIIMGSRSDWDTMQHAASTLTALGVPHETKIVSAHRTPRRLYDYASEARARGLQVIIAGAGGAAHLPGMTAAMTPLPVFGVPVESHSLKGMDSLLSIVQMPAGVPVGTLAIGRAGAVNAALLSAGVLALQDSKIAAALDTWRDRQTADVGESPVAAAASTRPARKSAPAKARRKRS